jgi:hypothetical protein
MLKQHTLRQWKAYRKARALKARALALYPGHDVQFVVEVDAANPHITLGDSDAVLTLKITRKATK